MNLFALLTVILQVLLSFGIKFCCSTVESTDCGLTPIYPTEQIVGGNIISPDEYSWLGSLKYRNEIKYGICGGSVISSRYVLTAAHCVTGELPKSHGGLIGVRLGDFTQKPYCDYGTPNCSSYQQFGIENIKVHENYRKDSETLVLHNDIALLRLDADIRFDDVLKPVCLPINTREPMVNTQLIVSGWGATEVSKEPLAKRSAGIPIVTDPEFCEYQDKSRMCAGVPASTTKNAKTSCDGDSGGPLMRQSNKRQMVIEGIASFHQGGSCVNEYFATHYTRVRNYLSWIQNNMCIGQDCQTSALTLEQKYPTDCGNTPMYPRTQIVGSKTVSPDEYSWAAILQYEEKHRCAGSVINSRYVLTAAHCVHEITLKLTGVRLGKYDKKGHLCDYGSKDCSHYQEFGIEKIIPHRDYFKNDSYIVNDIALIRMDRPVQFSSKLKPICLPFGGNSIPEPAVNTHLTVTGWGITLENDYTPQKRDASISLWEKDRCKQFFTVDETHICAVGADKKTCRGDSGGPLMRQFARRRMVLEGIVSAGRNCKNSDIPDIYTRVRSYADWLDQNLEMF